MLSLRPMPVAVAPVAVLPVAAPLIAAVLAAAPPATAEDYFLTIGGGYNPTGNQVSLERNVLFQRQVLAEVRPDAGTPETYFAAGDSGAPDLQYRDPAFETTCPRARRLMALLFGRPGEVDLCYRPHQIDRLAGPADASLLKRRFKKLAREVNAGDRLFLYFTGHGGEASDPSEYGYDEDYEYEDYEYAEEDAPYNEHNTVMYLWEEEEITAGDFSELLDELPAGVPVVMVMVQCFSGGFAHTIFHQADAELGLSPRPRCGFFSQRHDRYAAGCTPDINEADYQEYSSFFWAAIAGRTRGGEPIGDDGLGADYDADGAVSLAEAHAYAVIESDTIDIPIRTTGALLREYSTLAESAGDGDEDEADDERSKSPIGALFGILGKKRDAKGESGDGGAGEPPAFMRLSGPLDGLLKQARPDQAAIVRTLVEQLRLGDGATVETVRGKQKQLTRQAKKATGKYALARRSFRRARRKLREKLAEQWPELETPYAPLAAELCSERADEFVAAVDALPGIEAFRRARERYQKASDADSAAEHRQAKAERLLRTCENIVLAANLPLVAPQAIVDRYEALLELEEATLTPARTKSEPTGPPTAQSTASVTVDTIDADTAEQ
ncbi:MAG: hypothetical protein AAGB00_11240 [Planctomycetota bacterium]